MSRDKASLVALGMFLAFYSLLCSESLSISPRDHPGAFLGALGVSILAFIIIPEERK